MLAHTNVRILPLRMSAGLSADTQSLVTAALTKRTLDEIKRMYFGGEPLRRVMNALRAYNAGVVYVPISGSHGFKRSVSDALELHRYIVLHTGAEYALICGERLSQAHDQVEYLMSRATGEQWVYAGELAHRVRELLVVSPCD